jgi:hypothetical protein
MEYIALNTAFDAIVTIPGSANTDVVTYRILTSTGTVFATGNAVYVSGSIWKVTFTPIVLGGVYIVEVTDSTLDVVYTQYFKAVSSTTLTSGLVEEDEDPPTAQEMLDAVNKAILKGVVSGISSYQVKGRSFTYKTLDELRTIRKELQKEIQQTMMSGTTMIGRNLASF